MNWVVATLLSALFLGFYDLCTKHSVRHNAVTPVFFFSTLTGALVWGAARGKSKSLHDTHRQNDKTNQFSSGVFLMPRCGSAGARQRQAMLCF